MTILSFVSSEMSDEEAKNLAEAIIDQMRMRNFFDKVLVNNKVYMTVEDKTLAQILEESNKGGL